MKTKEIREGDKNMAHIESIYRKRQRVGYSGFHEIVDDKGGGFKRADYVYDDKTTADVLLHLTWTSPCHNLAASASDASTVNETFSQQIHLHAQVLKKCRYFEALLSERWQEWRLKDEEQGEPGAHNRDEPILIKMTVAPTRDVDSYIMTFGLLYSYDFANEIVDIQKALTILPVAAELLFDDCISACVAFLEAVPWNPEEERQILRIVTDLQLEGGSSLLARLGPPSDNGVEEMLSGLVHSATHTKVASVASVKTFVALMLSDHASRETVRLVLEKAFATSLKIVKDSVEEYSNPNVRGLDDEIEALQRQNLYTAAVNARSLLWLIERMIELKVAKTAVEEWSDQDNLTANLKRALSEDLWRNVAPGLPGVVLRCTCRLASAVATGSIIASRQVRLKLVKDWLPVLIVSRDNQRPAIQIKQLHQELEDVFLRIISTLPMADAQKLLQQCLCFATRTVEDCSHLVSAFNTWFRRATHNPFLALEKDQLLLEDS